MKRPVLAAIALTVVAAPATASAATIQVASSNASPTIVYTAAPGEVNALEMHGTVGGPFDFRMPFFEYSAPLSAGAGCADAQPTVCGAVGHAFPVSVALADGDDVASTNSFTGNLTMSAGSGSDDVLAGGIDATADGGSGDDTILLAANNLATGTGGYGRDRLAAGLGAAAARLDGGSKADLVVSDAFAFGDVHGGYGNDALVGLSGTQLTLSGDGGSDALVAPASSQPRVTLDGGSGDDIAYSHAGGVAVAADSGDDTVDVRGGSTTAPDTVTCGSGHDVVYADAGDDVASGCEKVVFKAAPTLTRVVEAQAAAHALLAHRPNPRAL
jgi:Ca2+-binding RTX toxin-like protein